MMEKRNTRSILALRGCGFRGLDYLLLRASLRAASCDQEPWEAQEKAHRDRSRVKFSFCVRLGVETRRCGECCFALNRLQWVRNGLTLTTADDYNSKVLSETRKAKGG